MNRVKQAKDRRTSQSKKNEKMKEKDVKTNPASLYEEGKKLGHLIFWKRSFVTLTMLTTILVYQ